MSAFRLWWDRAFLVLWWALLLVGLVKADAWMFGPAAFFLLYNRLDDDR